MGSESGMKTQDLLDLIALGVKMRSAQKRYFKTRDRDALTESKALEKEFDAKAAQIMERYKGSVGDE